MNELETAPAVPPETAASSPASQRTSSRLDLLERLLVLGFYGYFFWNFIPSFLEKPTWAIALVIISEGVTVLALLVRRPAYTFSTSVGAWFLALSTTVTPALLIPAKNPIEPAWVGAILVTVGMCGRILCTIYLGRSFGLVAANRGVKRTGPYRLVRHPMYTSYLITHAGAFWLNPMPWNELVYALCWSLMIVRILVEESHLRQDPAYVAYQETVRYRLIPGLF